MIVESIYSDPEYSSLMNKCQLEGVKWTTWTPMFAARERPLNLITDPTPFERGGEISVSKRFTTPLILTIDIVISSCVQLCLADTVALAPRKCGDNLTLLMLETEYSG